jgi:uncharacterized protein (TIGR02391 family)
MSQQAPSFSNAQLEALCRTLAETQSGLTGSEIGRLLQEARVADPDPVLTKWKRLFNALVSAHKHDRDGRRVLSFIRHALEPARYVGRRDQFEARRQAVNVTLAFVGLEYRQDGRFVRVEQATTLSEAEQRASRLRAALSERGVHTEVLYYCRAELLDGNCFHAVLEASKGVAERLRQRGASTKDGADLVDEVLGGAAPRLRINQYTTDSEKSEQRGFVNLLKGLFGTFRNPTAHTPRIVWNLAEADALDLFSLCSYVHRRIDACR